MAVRFLGSLTGDDWHEARAGRVGGSDLGSIIGHGYLSRDELLSEKLGTTRREPSEAMRRGHYAEAYLTAWLAGEKGIELDPAQYGTYHGDDYAVINPDGITDGAVVEFKCHATRDGFGRAGTDQIPANHLAQVQWACGWLGLDRWYLAVHATKIDQRGSTFDDALYRGRFDPAFFAWLQRRARDFHYDMTERRAA